MFVLAIEGYEKLELDKYGPEIDRIASMAINRSVDRGRAWVAGDMASHVKFPSGYISKNSGRLYVDERASSHKLEASIVGRKQPTSLARFVTGGTGKKKDIQVQVRPGRTRKMPNAFLMNLRSGNKGLAVRTKAGERPRGAYVPRRIKPGLWLLYGPSVDQVFKTILGDRKGSVEKIEDFLQEEFSRLFDLRFEGKI